ncbi:hypothetical protein GIB67_012191 [Kingdonia uniflora]|uniref:Uncharacterized protein n=1 Tax=Kingdonia uniflora TaxID=39325 RepID=A0A7J7NNV8_9MAGN|nr:hypothetical protein GIB67_012191 [Kingdonia uniflora]
MFRVSGKVKLSISMMSRIRATAEKDDKNTAQAIAIHKNKLGEFVNVVVSSDTLQLPLPQPSPIGVLESNPQVGSTKTLIKNTDKENPRAGLGEVTEIPVIGAASGTNEGKVIVNMTPSNLRVPIVITAVVITDADSQKVNTKVSAKGLEATNVVASNEFQAEDKIPLIFVAGLYLASSSLASDMGNLVPAITFVIVAFVRYSALDIHHDPAKLDNNTIDSCGGEIGNEDVVYQSENNKSSFNNGEDCSGGNGGGGGIKNGRVHDSEVVNYAVPY